MCRITQNCIIGEIKVGIIHQYKTLETKVGIVSTLTSLSKVDNMFYKTI